jgi:hypothetical protein
MPDDARQIYAPSTDGAASAAAMPSSITAPCAKTSPAPAAARAMAARARRSRTTPRYEHAAAPRFRYGCRNYDKIAHHAKPRPPITKRRASVPLATRFDRPRRRRQRTQMPMPRSFVLHLPPFRRASRCALASQMLERRRTRPRREVALSLSP